MIRRGVIVVTTPAIRKVVVVAEIDFIPVVGVVAFRALAKVVVRAAVTGFTVIEASVVKPIFTPGINNVAI
jgi:hypothetical protein